MKKVLLFRADNFACGYYRMIQPYSILQKEQDEFQFDLYDINQPAKTNIELAGVLADYDAVVVQRPATEAMLIVIESLKRLGKKVIVEFDDDLLGVDHKNPAFSVWNPASIHSKIFQRAVSVADYVHVSTPELANKYRKLNDNIFVFQNGLDTKDEKFRVNRRSEMPEDKTVVMWSGSSSHIGSMKMISKELKQVFDARPNTVFALCSNKEFLNLFNIKDEQKIYVPHVKFDEFYSIPSMADIALAPVELSEFNTCKSELKCLESGIFGIPTVSTSIAPYRRFNQVSNGGNWLVKSNERRNWLEGLYNLIDDTKLRKEMSDKTIDAVVNHYDVRIENAKRMEFYRQILS